MSKAHLLAPLLVCALTALPAEASTVPRVDFKEGQITGAIGLLIPVRGALDLALDYARSDTESYGLTVMGVPLTGAPPGFFRERLPGLWLAAARYTRRLDTTPDGLSWGGTVAGGLAPVFAETTASVVPPPNFIFVQPALVVAWRFTLFDFPSALRSTLGPVISLGGIGPSVGTGAGGGADFGLAAWLWPNAELAVGFGPGQEVTLGGNSLLGWRGTF